jgi:hypothetical protein
MIYAHWRRLFARLTDTEMLQAICNRLEHVYGRDGVEVFTDILRNAAIEKYEEQQKQWADLPHISMVIEQINREWPNGPDEGCTQTIYRYISFDIEYSDMSPNGIKSVRDICECDTLPELRKWFKKVTDKPTAVEIDGKAVVPEGDVLEAAIMFRRKQQ